jgi:formylglycine-generating enzyme required for sulfatase activity
MSADQTDRVVRGGSWFLSSTEDVIATIRYNGPPKDHGENLGFRVVLRGGARMPLKGVTLP